MSKTNLQSKTQILIIGGASKIAREAFKLAAAKLPVRTTFIKKAL